MAIEVFFNPDTDFGFKKLFGEEQNKHLLMSFINDLLGDAEKVVDLTLNNSEYLPSNHVLQESIFDIYCTNEKGEHFIVEMQKIKYKSFKDRAGYYASFLIANQAAKLGESAELKAIYCIGILGFVFNDYGGNADAKDVIHTVQLQNQHNQVFYDKLKYITVEMPNFNKSLAQLKTHCDQWLYFIKNLNLLDQMPELFTGDIIAQGFEVARVAAFDEQERMFYESSLKDYRDMYSIVKTAVDDERERYHQQYQQKHQQGKIKSAN